MAGTKTAPKYIHTLNINGLKGRILHLPAPKKRAPRVLLIYGFGSRLERIRPLADRLNAQAEVLVPDLPGFGGMSSLHELGIVPTIDAQADYIATMIKLRFGKESFCLAGLDYGFLVADHLLRKYPDISHRVTHTVCLAGITDYQDLQLPKLRLYAHRLFVTLVTLPFLANLTHAVALLIRPRLKQLKTDLRTYLRARRDVLFAHHADKKLRHTLYYLPGCDGILSDQTQVSTHLKSMYKKVVIETEFALRCDKEQVDLQPLRRRKKLSWL